MAEQQADAGEVALAAIRALSADYLSKLPTRLDEIEQAWNRLQSGDWNSDTARDLHRTVHGITGSGRIFGLPEVSDAARIVEAELQHLVTADDDARAALFARITTGLARLREAEQCASR